MTIVRRLLGWLPLASVLVGAGLLGAMREAGAGSDLRWIHDYSQAIGLARRLHQPMLITFHVAGCGWCSKLDAETFADPQLVDLTRRYVCVRLDGEVDGPVAARYHVSDYPTTLLTDEHGKVLTRVAGFVPPGTLTPLLRAGLRAGETE